VQTWTFVRFLHLAGITFFVGGQLLLVVAVAPALRAAADDGPMRAVARRFGIGSAIALAVIIASGAAMASHFHLWGDSVLHAKLLVLALIFALTGLHALTPYTRPLSYAVVVLSFVMVWLGLKLTYG
jgi:uncharacterized membrane protein